MYCFGRICLILESDCAKLGKLRHFDQEHDFYTRTLPRLANRQLKHVFLRLLRAAMDRVLKTLDHSFRSSKGTWTTAFYGMLGLAMALDDMEDSLAMFQRTEVKLGHASRAEAEADLNSSSSLIDEKFSFFRKIFRYKHRFNPLNCTTPAQQKVRRAKLGDAGVHMAEAVGRLTSEKRKPPMY